MSAIWKERERLGLDNARFIGYWEKGCPVKAMEEGIYVSCYERDGQPLVLIVSNLTDKRQSVTLENAGDAVMKMPAAFELDSEDFRYIELE